MASHNEEHELKSILDEVRRLRLEIDILKMNPTIGSAVQAVLDHAQAHPGKLPASAYNVAVKSIRPPQEDPADRG
jgi:hypothetical protein